MTKNYDPKIWGPAGWEFLLTIAVNYDKTKFDSYKLVFDNLGSILPCNTCRDNYADFLKNHPLTSTTDLLDWVVQLHNKSARHKITKEAVSRIMDVKYGRLVANNTSSGTLTRRMKIVNAAPTSREVLMGRQAAMPIQKKVAVRKSGGCACSGGMRR